MGLRSATVACQWLTDAVCYMYSSHMYNILNYLDDFTGVSHPDTALGTYNFVGNVLCDLHLEESVQKAEPPSTSMTIPGIHFDTIPMTMSVTAERSAAVHGWQAHIRVQMCPLFLSHILDVLRAISDGNSHSNVYLMTFIAS